MDWSSLVRRGHRPASHRADHDFGKSKLEQEIGAAQRDHPSGAVFPLAMPSIASPGAMPAIVIRTDNHRNSLAERAVTAGVLLVVPGLTLVLLLAAISIYRFIGNTGASVISRVRGIILAPVAVESVLAGFEALDVLTTNDTGAARKAG